MEHYHHRKRNNKTKIFLWVFVLVLFGILAFKYIYVPYISSVNGPGIVATTTPVKKPVVTKPKPVSGPPKITITPGKVEQGEPAIITVEGLTSTTSVKSFTFNNRPLISFMYEGYVTAFLGVDLYAVPGTFPLVLTLNDGKEVRGEFVINQRADVRKPFDIPEKLGGNTPESVKTLIKTLAEEGKIINAVFTTNQVLWTEKFRSPLNGPLVIDDPYGYTRIINNFTMPHKGTDLEATMGTPVYAMNKGVVRLASSFRNYGDTVILDHGVGLQTVYMHLSKINVAPGQAVNKGELLGLSGDSGYTLNPHLHLTVRIWDVSIDPIKFLELFGE